MLYIPLHIVTYTIFLAYIVVAYQDRPIDDRIIGGAECPLEDYPFTVSIIRTMSSDSSFFLCGGVIITFTKILTAAHCLDSEKTEEIVVGAGTPYSLEALRLQRHGSPVYQKRRAVSTKLHDKYNKEGFLYDIGIISLESQLFESELVKVATLPQYKEYSDTCLHAVIIGWGSTRVASPRTFVVSTNKDNHVQCAEVPLLHNYDDCKDRLARVNIDKDSIDDSIICALDLEAGKDACVGDSGGPLVCNGVVIGLVASGVGCGIRGEPGLYTNVAQYYSFIMENTGIKLPFESVPPGENQTALRDKEESGNKGETLALCGFLKSFALWCIVLNFF